MSDFNYDRFQKFFTYLDEKGVINLEESSDLLTEYLQNGYVTFENLSEPKAKQAKDLFYKYTEGKLTIK